MHAKDEALKALSQARKMVDDPEPLVSLRLVQLRSLLGYAEEMVEAVQELKRQKKEKRDVPV